MTKDVRHPLFEELDAFDPNWQNKYPNLRTAVKAAAEETPYIETMLLQYTLENPRHDIDDVPDMKGYIEECQKAEEESPYFQRARRTMDWMMNNFQKEEWSE